MPRHLRNTFQCTAVVLLIEGRARTAGFTVVSKVISSISLISDRRKCRREGYRMHHTSLDGRSFLAEAKNDAAPKRNDKGWSVGLESRWKPLLCLIQIFGWYKNPRVAPISSQSRIFWNKPSSQRLVNDESTFATTDSSTSKGEYMSQPENPATFRPTRKRLDHQRQDILLQTPSTNACCHIYDALKERVP